MEKKGGEQPALTKKCRSRALASKHQFGRPVKMLETSWLLWIRHKAGVAKPQIPKPRAKLSVPTKARWPMPTTSSNALLAFVFKT